METLNELVGKEVTFSPTSLSIDYWCDKDELKMAKKYKNKKCTICCVAINLHDNKDYSYFDIQFKDGYVMKGVSGIELYM